MFKPKQNGLFKYRLLFFFYFSPFGLPRLYSCTACCFDLFFLFNPFCLPLLSTPLLVLFTFNSLPRLVCCLVWLGLGLICSVVLAFYSARVVAAEGELSMPVRFMFCHWGNCCITKPGLSGWPVYSQELQSHLIMQHYPIGITLQWSLMRTSGGTQMCFVCQRSCLFFSSDMQIFLQLNDSVGLQLT